MSCYFGTLSQSTISSLPEGNVFKDRNQARASLSFKKSAYMAVFPGNELGCICGFNS
jgi:hypothetical protein